MVIIYNTQTHEVYGAFESAELCEDGITRGYPSNDKRFWRGYDPSCNPEIAELMEEQAETYDPSKSYTWDGETLTEVEPSKDEVAELKTYVEALSEAVDTLLMGTI